jgi:hypothetical protein
MFAFLETKFGGKENTNHRKLGNAMFSPVCLHIEVHDNMEIQIICGVWVITLYPFSTAAIFHIMNIDYSVWFYDYLSPNTHHSALQCPFVHITHYIG